MRRRKPQSGKAKKEHLQAKRAEKRDDGPHTSTTTVVTPSKTSFQLVKRHANGKGAGAVLSEDRQRAEARRTARAALESRFIKLPQTYVDHYRSVLAKRPFTRPIEAGVARMVEEDLGVLAADGTNDCLLCPKRPKWKYYMTKKEVEKNESIMFENWLSNTESRLHEQEAKAEFQVMGYFERNLDVWRQLWRVSEVSEILLVLLDVRCPLLHLPISLQDYVSTLKPRKKCILILTKVDLVPKALANAWKAYLEERYKYEVVMVESYKEHERGENTQGTRTRYDPGASLEVRKSLVAALKNAHNDLCTPPEQMKEENKSRWRPRVRTGIEWNSLINVPEAEALRRAEVKARRDASTSRRGHDVASHQGSLASSVEELSKAEAKKLRRLQRQEDLESKSRKQKLVGSKMKEEDSDDDDNEASVDEGSDGGDGEEHQDGHYERPPFLSIGLIGQPNVGKSSLLNALLGRKVVRASRTPGKTKSLQTIYWSKEVRLVDCPGLVFPSFVGMEKQVMAGVIPIQNVEAVIHELGQRMPLEKILDLKMPEELYDERQGEVWSTDTLLATFALDRGFLTAKAARPDVYRAGSMLIRAFHSSQIAWSFRPSIQQVPLARQEGIWLPDFQAGRARARDIGAVPDQAAGHETEDAGVTSELDEVSTEEETDASEEEEEEEESDESEEAEDEPDARSRPGASGKSAFALLALDDAESESDSSS